jgi:nucleoside 2-deoxyribosyltransferase
MMKTVYLAGGISHNTFDEATQWRTLAADYLALHGIKTLDPMRGKHADKWQDGEANFDHPGFSTAAIFFRDTADIQNSDAILVNLETAKSVGTPWEMGYAYALGIPLFIVCPVALHSHPFICEPAAQVSESFEAVLKDLVMRLQTGCQYRG